MPPRTKGKSKKELLADQIAAAVGAGREVAVETVDFSDPNRPKTCLEVDFPIIPINQIAAIEGNAGKPIYLMSKWWARRRSSVFRSMLLPCLAQKVSIQTPGNRCPQMRVRPASACRSAYGAPTMSRCALTAATLPVRPRIHG